MEENLKAGSFLLISVLFLCLSGDAQGKKEVKKGPDPLWAESDSSLRTYKQVTANPWLKGNAFKRFFVGKNYRKEWSRPIKVPVLNMATEQGGLIPKKEGGGKQTRSLQVADSSGKEWALRSVEKYPEAAIPEEFRKTIAASIVKDAISASYPYGALSVGPLAHAAGVPYLKDKLVYLPDDTALGEFRSKYKNMLALMEEKEPGKEELKRLGANKKAEMKGTGEVIYELASSSNNKIDQREVLKARLLDNFIMDFDRHEEQWTWMGVDSADGKIYYAVPKDRDQAFFTNQGLLPKIARVKKLFPELQGFRAKAKNIVTFNRAARNFDHYFLNQLSEEDWAKAIDEFLATMTDSVIEAALQQQPKEIQKYSMAHIIGQLKEKRKYFKDQMLKYYRSLAESVNVVGTNEREEFSIKKWEDESVLITVYHLDSLGQRGSVIYERRLYEKDTKEIILYGLEQDDRFVAEGGKSKIKIRMIGGPGQDQFINQGNKGKLLAYDVNFERNTITGKGIENKISGDPQNNTYTRMGYAYNFLTPDLSAEVSNDGGLYLGPKVKIIRQGFRREPYSIYQTLGVNRSLSAPFYNFKYRGRFIRIYNHTDLEINAILRLPTHKTYFFGMGNNSPFRKSREDPIDYYLARYDLGNVSALANTRLNSWLRVKYGPIFQYVRLRDKENANNFIGAHDGSGQDGINIHERKYYAGGELQLEIDTKNDEVIPTRGIYLNAYGRDLRGLNTYSNNLEQVGGRLSLFTDFLAKNKLVLATTFGADHNIGSFEIAQAQYLGYRDGLRGFRIQRFAGRSRAFNNTELRWKAGHINTYLFPASFGFLIYNDVGRVWGDGEKSSTWHHGYGAGIWIAPIDRFVFTGSISRSREEPNLGLFTFGFQF